MSTNHYDDYYDAYYDDNYYEDAYDDDSTTSTTTTTTTTLSVCDSVGWVDGKEVGLGCLLMEESTPNMTNPDATVFCRSRNSHLVEIFTKEQMQFIVAKLKNKRKCGTSVCGWWAGGTKKHGGDWYWIYSGKLVPKLVWKHGQEPLAPKSLGSSDSFGSMCLHESWAKDLDFYGANCNIFDLLIPVCQRKYIFGTNIRIHLMFQYSF